MMHSRLLRNVVAVGGAFKLIEVAGGHGTAPVCAVVLQKFLERENLRFGDKQADLVVVAASLIAVAGLQQRLAENFKIESERRMSLSSVLTQCGFCDKFRANDLGCPRYVMVGLAVDDEWIERSSGHPYIAQDAGRKVKASVIFH
jgi:hypothetical protein